METDSVSDPPFRRTWFAKALAAWLGLALIGLLTLVPLFELIGYLPYKLMLATMGLAAVALVGWCLWRIVQRPRSGWVSPLALIATAALYVALATPVANAGLFLNFMRHKPAYDRIIAEAKAGRLRGSRSEEGALTGVHQGERFQVTQMRPLHIHFEGWQAGDYDVFEIYYSEQSCPNGNKGRPLRQAANAGQPEMMALGYTLHLGGHYCLRRLIV